MEDVPLTAVVLFIIALVILAIIIGGLFLEVPFLKNLVALFRFGFPA